MARPDSFLSAGRVSRTSLLISAAVTLAGLALYAHTYLVESHSWLAQFVASIELKTYDTRFRVRGRTPPSAQIVIVGIDQATLERLGSWPFSRLHYVRMLERLKKDGAAVVAFDINFPKPDEKSGLESVRRARDAYLARTPPARRDPGYLARLEEMEREADTDVRFAAAIEAAGNVVLGYFFFPSQEEVGALDAAAQKEADGLLAFSSYSTRAARDPHGNAPPPLASLFGGEAGYAAQTNLPAFTQACDFSVGYFNFYADADSVFRREPLVMKYGAAWQGEGAPEPSFFPSLDVQILRRYLKRGEHEMVLVYNAAGVEAVELGDLRIPTDVFAACSSTTRAGREPTCTFRWPTWWTARS